VLCWCVFAWNVHQAMSISMMQCFSFLEGIFLFISFFLDTVLSGKTTLHFPDIAGKWHSGKILDCWQPYASTCCYACFWWRHLCQPSAAICFSVHYLLENSTISVFSSVSFLPFSKRYSKTRTFAKKYHVYCLYDYVNTTSLGDCSTMHWKRRHFVIDI